MKILNTTLSCISVIYGGYIAFKNESVSTLEFYIMVLLIFSVVITGILPRLHHFKENDKM